IPTPSPQPQAQTDLPRSQQAELVRPEPTPVVPNVEPQPAKEKGEPAPVGHSKAEDLPAAFYRQRITMPTAMTADLKAALNDLVETLRLITGRTFGGEAGDPDVTDLGGILLARIGAKGLPVDGARAVPEGSSEAFALWPEGDSRLWLLARSDAGLGQAI